MPLLSIQQNSITLKFNRKIITTTVAPGAEIWRRGADLPDIHQLVLGEEIYLKCNRSPATGAVTASIIAAAEENDTLDLTPHRITAIRVCAGRLIATGSL